MTKPRGQYPDLTKVEHRLLAFLEKFVTSYSYLPSTWEVKDGMGYKSQASVTHIMRKIREKGYLTYGAYGNRKSYAFNKAKIVPPMAKMTARAEAAEAILKRCYRLDLTVELTIDIHHHFTVNRLKLEKSHGP